MSSVYLAGKMAFGEQLIEDFAEELEQRGHHILAKWWEFNELPTPYLDHTDTSSNAARIMINAAMESDVTILFPTERILGAAVEFGAAIASTKINHNKLVIVVNPFETRQSVFYTHESAIAVSGVAQIRQMDWF